MEQSEMTDAQILEQANARLCNIRLTGHNKRYYAYQLASYAKHTMLRFKGTRCVQFGKQDIRGGLSITLITEDHCIDHQRHFESKDLMLGFIVGCNDTRANRDWL